MVHSARNSGTQGAKRWFIFVRNNQSYITYSKNQCRQNYSVFVISLNNDYAKQIDEDFFKYIQSLEKDLNFITKNIIGFEHKNNAILYLRELLQVKNDEYDEFFLKIINRFSTKPYYFEYSVN